MMCERRISCADVAAARRWRTVDVPAEIAHLLGMDEGNTWAILLAGEVVPTERLRAQLEGARVLAADAGLIHAERLGVTPELVIGDFDSADAALIERHGHLPRQAYPVAKDMTDGQLAIEHALAQGAGSLLLVGALGGARSDHAVMHLLHLADLARRGIRALATSGREEALGLAPGEHEIDLPAGTTFSLLPFDDLHDVHLSGARWPLAGETLPLGHSRPLSNVAEGSLKLRIGRGHGVLLAQLYHVD